MGFKFPDELKTGITEIDMQHEELYKRTKTFFDACLAGHGKEVIEDLIIYLEEYVTLHFSTEEDLMSKYGYNRSVSHNANHNQFKELFNSIKKEFNETGGNVKVIVAASKTLSGWLVTHIKNEDIPLAGYIKKKSI